MEDVVVVGYGVQKKRTFTGAVSTIKAKEIETFRLVTWEPPYRAGYWV